MSSYPIISNSQHSLKMKESIDRDRERERKERLSNLT